MNIKSLTSYAVLKDRGHERIAYTYDVIDEKGNLVDSNKKASYIILDEETKQAVSNLEQLIVDRMNEN